MQYNEYLKVGVEAARSAGALIKDSFTKDKRVLNKSTSVDLVTETDEAAEALIFDRLRCAFPNHLLIGEESVAHGNKSVLTDDPTWIVDPLDGTTNFVHRFPFVAVSIALAINKEVVVGVVYNCILDEMFTATLGGGAFCNEQPITVSGETELGRALIATEFGSNREAVRLDTISANIHSLAGNPNAVHSIRCMGSAALNMCMVARGSSDAYYEYGIHCWDYSAGLCIVLEAGGVVSDPTGGDVDIMACAVLCAGSKALADTIAKNIKPVKVVRDDA